MKWFTSLIVILFARTVAAGFYVFLPGRVRESARVYRALFPEKGLLAIYCCVWRQYQRFTRIHTDRFRFVPNSDRVLVTTEGWEELEKGLERKEGAILLMSHVGNWDAAAHLLKKMQPDLRLLIYMGKRAGQHLEKLQREGLANEGIQVVAVDQQGSASPFQLIEANTFLNEGGLVALTGDRLWHESQRKVAVRFLGHEVLLPESPHLLALISEKPLYTLFPIRTGKRQFHVQISPPVRVTAKNRGDRKKAVQNSAQAYSNLLEEAARRHPYEWFHFEPFLGKSLDSIE